MLKSSGKFFVLFFLFFVGLQGFSQTNCKIIAKTKCLPKLKPYLNTEQLYTTTMLNGDKTSLPFTFYYGLEYRIIICTQEALGKITFNLRDGSNKILFTTFGYNTIQWDFHVENTEDMTIEVLSSEVKGDGLDKSGCATIIVGFK